MSFRTTVLHVPILHDVKTVPRRSPRGAAPRTFDDVREMAPSATARNDSPHDDPRDAEDEADRNDRNE
jgi:hypothetical protein